MKTMKFLTSVLMMILMVSATAWASNDLNDNNNPVETIEPKEEASIVGVAASNDNFSTLVAAVKAADLVGTLDASGPFTVFAPTNDAFAKLPDGTVQSLLKEENREALTSILTYHVVSGKVTAADVLKAIEDNDGKFVITTVNGEKLKAYTKDGKVMLKDAKGNHSTIIMTDIEASNGVIHAIDTVVMP